MILLIAIVVVLWYNIPKYENLNEKNTIMKETIE